MEQQVRPLSLVSRSLLYLTIDSQAARAGLCALLLAAVVGFAPQIVFAQHGSGAHAGGGGFGGGRTGGGGGFGGGSSAPHSSPPPSSRPTPGPAPVHQAPARQPAHVFVPPTSSGGTSSTAAAAASGSGSSNAAQPVIHMPLTPLAGGGNASSTAQSAGGIGTEQGIRSDRTAPLSFSGQGHDIWQNQASRSGSVTRTPGTTTSLFGSHPIEGSLPRGNPPGRIFYPPVIGSPFYPGFYPGFGFYGGGYGLGFGSFGCDPFSIWGCSSFGYGFGNGVGYGFGNGAFGYDNYYSPYYGFGAPIAPGPSSTYNQQDTPASPSSEYTIPYTYEPPAGPQDPPSSDARPDTSGQDETALYLKDGSMILVRDYWVASGQLHYRAVDGTENRTDWNSVDVQKTVDENAKRGVNFTLRPADDAAVSPQSNPTDGSQPDSTPTLKLRAPAPDSATPNR